VPFVGVAAVCGQLTNTFSPQWTFTVATCSHLWANYCHKDQNRKWLLRTKFSRPRLEISLSYFKAYRSLLVSAFHHNTHEGVALIPRPAVYAPNETSTLINLANYVTSLKSQTGGSEPNSKKRKLESQILPKVDDTIVFAIADVSFSIPVRKKLRLQGLNGAIRALDASGNTEALVTWESIGMLLSWSSLLHWNWSWSDYVFCLPVPERAKPQHNFVVIPKQDSGSDIIVWTAPDINPKAPSPDQGPHVMAQHLDVQLAKFAKRVTWPDDNEFISVSSKAGKSYGVRAHRGSKEGRHLTFVFWLRHDWQSRSKVSCFS